MSIDKGTSADELGRAFAALLRASRVMPDVMQLWRAVAAVHEEARLRRNDGTINELDVEDADGEAPRRNDPVAWMVRANAMLLSSNIRYGLKWQRLMQRQLPVIRHRMEDYREDDDPLPEVRSALIDAIRTCLQEAAELVGDHGRHLQEEIEKLARELLPDESGSCAGENGKRPRRARIIS